MNDPNLQELHRKIEALTKGLGEAQQLLQDLAKGETPDPKQQLIDAITALLPKLSVQHLQSVRDFAAFLAAGGPGGGENQPPTGEGGP